VTSWSSKWKFAFSFLNCEWRFLNETSISMFGMNGGALYAWKISTVQFFSSLHILISFRDYIFKLINTGCVWRRWSLADLQKCWGWASFRLSNMDSRVWNYV
jgi:hypothetical protein